MSGDAADERDDTDDDVDGRSESNADPDSESGPESEPEPGPDLGPETVGRLFDVLEAALTGDAVEGAQLDRLLDVLEAAVGDATGLEEETLAELLALLEAVLVGPAELEAAVDDALDVLEAAVGDATGLEEETLSPVFDVLEAGTADPEGLTPEDVERLRRGLETAARELTGPAISPAVDRGAADGERADRFRLARLATAVTRRATGYSVESGLRAGTRLAYAAATAESAAALLASARAVALDELRRAGVDVGEERVAWPEASEDGPLDRRPVTADRLRERGRRLLSRSAEVDRDESLHPAFPSILEALAADEARVLRLLATDGAQAYMDVRDRGYVPFSSRLVAEHMTMVGADAGCRQPERTPAYLQNLRRLGLVTFLEDPVDDLKRYQVLEAQPHIEAAREAARRPKTVYGRLRLTDLGVEFCTACLPVEVDAEREEFRRVDEGDEE
ncbi:hypothetical protein BRC88_04495 [Halobacteriales archaeon QS_4_69_225]|nr:MAG: hypothetical protein BRC88_04495 [Halobacteriales archaeon QS_4_69_225]